MTPKQAAFVAEYTKDGNATQSAIRAGYSAHTADVQGPRLLGNVAIQQALQQVKADAVQRVQESQTEAVVTAQAILQRAWQIANTDARDRGQHLAIAARAFPEFKDGVVVDNRQQTLVLPEGTTLDDLRRLRAELE